VEYVRGEKANLGCLFPGVSVEEEGLFSLFSLKFTASLQRCSCHRDSVHLRRSSAINKTYIYADRLYVLFECVGFASLAVITVLTGYPDTNLCYL
jgi:hypothetical protein